MNQPVPDGWIDRSVVTLTNRIVFECHYPESSRANTDLPTTGFFVVEEVRIVSATSCLIGGIGNIFVFDH